MKKFFSLIIIGLVLGGLVWTGCQKKAEEKVVKIGWIGPLSGDAAYYGEMVKYGTDLAVEEINQSGGIREKKIKVIYEDDQLDPKKGTSAFKKLVTIEHVPVVIQAAGSSVMLAEAPLAEKYKVVLISPTCSNDDIKYAGDYVFRIWPSDSFQGKVLADFTYSTLGVKRAAVLYINNDYGEGLKNEFVKEFKFKGGTVVLVDSFDQSNTDFRTILTKLKEDAPEVVCLASLYRESALLVKQAKEMGIKTQFIGGDGNFAPDLIKLAGGTTEGMIVTNMHWNPESNDPLVKHFVTDFKNRYGKVPEVYAAAGYDCLKVLADAIRRGGYSSDQIKNTLYVTKGFKGVTGDIGFDKYGEIINKEYDKFIVKNGQFVSYRR
jgi:branched-chain amino acid transport system substrate-binding protein